MIEAYSFGKMRIQGKDYTQDLKIIKGGVVPRWWRKSGHSVEPDDVRDMLEAAPDTLILGKGRPGVMQSTPELKSLLQQKGIELVEAGTDKAWEEFNRRFARGENIAAGFHLTC
ncbi:MTH938/NDUFAF3 family protein [Desulfonatronospira sp.]|uniref:Mth938-like domain-containing protein n=1 Tax=Desulfonatronospira sp. TaxID=1962951 RepID=UPI0025BE0107|nr:MTH938/NDUFAF3 family protein [Desulfonatronospira sp.]